jgi:hypothetical protein
MQFRVSPSDSIAASVALGCGLLFALYGAARDGAVGFIPAGYDEQL